MEYTLEISGPLDAKFRKMAARERKRLEIIGRKVGQILANPHHFKPLSGDMHGTRRVHIDGPFVLTYEIDEPGKTVRLLDFDHHDKIY